MPIAAAAIATIVRKGSRMRVSCAVSSSFPGTRAKSPAYSATSGRAKTMPSTTSAPVVIARPFTTLLPRRHAPAFPLSESSRVKVGTNAALIAPSANRSRTRFGTRNATTKASMSLPAPKNAAST